MSSVRPPPAPFEPSPPASRRRLRSGPDAFSILSRDGAAAVLLFARAKLEAERRRAPGLVNASLRAFASGVESAARSVTEGVHDDGVFIAPLFRLLRERDEVPSCPTLSSFKARLLQAYNRGLLELATCQRAEDVNPLAVAASTVRSRRITFHLVQRWSRRNMFAALDDVVGALSPKAYAAAKDFARKVHEDEKRREGRPRLITLPLDAFAARAQAVVNESSHDALVVELFRELDDRGEATGLGLSAFKARLRGAHRTGLLTLRAWQVKDGVESPAMQASVVGHEGMTLHLVCRTAVPLPIPWGRPAPLLVSAPRWIGASLGRMQ